MMRNILLVMRHDIGVILRQRGFWLVTFLMPLFFVGVQGYALVQDDDLAVAIGNDAEEEATPSEEDAPTTIALVDESGLIQEIPADVQSLFERFADKEEALSRLRADEVIQVVVIPEDYVTTGDVRVYDANFQFNPNSSQMGVAFGNNAWALQYVLYYNLLEDASLMRLLVNPLPEPLVTNHAVRPETAVPETGNEGAAILVSSLLPYIFYFLLLMGSSYMLRSVVAEKENRTVEVLLLSLPPKQLMVGKILAMTGILLVQITIWVGGGTLILDRGVPFLDLGGFSFPPGFMVWAVLFLVMGYMMFASLMAAAGAIARNAREGGQMTWLLVIPLMPTLLFGSMFAQEPNNPIVMAMSFFPMSAPSAMLTRMAVTAVPLWQVLVSFGGVTITTYIAITLAAKFFQSGNLLSSAEFSWKRFLSAWR